MSELKSWKLDAMRLKAEKIELERQRDALLGALKLWMSAGNGNSTDFVVQLEALKLSRALIKEIEETKCGFEENADLVGAINILAAGHAVLACGGMAQSGRPAKQEPTEATM